MDQKCNSSTDSYPISIQSFDTVVGRADIATSCQLSFLQRSYVDLVFLHEVDYFVDFATDAIAVEVHQL